MSEESAVRATVVAVDERPEEPDAARLDLGRWEALARAALESEGAVGELTVSFVGRDAMASLNEEHMGKSGPTDVLSFPLDTSDEPAVPGVPALLGDVVVCPAVAADQAPGHAGTIDDEIALLVVHGVLHVLGHDHAEPSEASRMRSRELEILRAHHWHGPEPEGFRLLHAEP